MALDHYVSQVHLKRFYSPELGNRMYALRKQDMKAFTPNSASICRIEGGSTNPYLQPPRSIEEFLKTIEPDYNRAVAELATGKFSRHCIYVIAGFVAYVLVCSPAGMRIQSGPIQETLKEVGRRLDRQGKFGKPPASLESESFIALLDSGKLSVSVDEKFPQAMGITSIYKLLIAYGNFAWEILQNPHADTPFFTSDYPIAIESGTSPTIINRVIPLTPSLAIRIHPDRSYDKKQNDFSFPGFRFCMKTLSRSEVREVNRLIVQCAETTVFYREDLPWVTRFVRKYSRYRIESSSIRIPYAKGMLLHSTWIVRERALTIVEA